MTVIGDSTRSATDPNVVSGTTAPSISGHVFDTQPALSPAVNPP